MEELNLSQRLKEVASLVPLGSKLLDVGSDHAYLPIYLLQHKKISSAIAGEVVHGPYQSALSNVKAHQLDKQITVRLADGLEALEDNDYVSVITICGMGGRLISTILENGKEKLSTISQLILQPNNREEELRDWLVANQFTITAEKILEENDKIYEIIVVKPGISNITQKEKQFGPFLSKEKSSIFVKKWQKEQKKLLTALKQIPENYQNEREQLSRKIEMIKEILNES
ncbi:tRNA (adenine(22)-N(1))-methyltransferase [Streptococcus sp. CSL10205-OR2]|uniref:tRNA (adenine(22)-N(1))-methyltransferase n=1 Tax=Streptococcus sp. CSL10205-OR2 TaxID=2980558 RepID=UPI0021D9723B|nr:tRNA (adenine(22)-N(1))-methyltransferase TrmK [Streptococcus sp. CSL10205-OR2]MCU9533172.1 tRNA (adenine(22)-N(1))-methyltransferase TrmK [Streptococcus sp. CSL10205-OR2]